MRTRNPVAFLVAIVAALAVAAAVPLQAGQEAEPAAQKAGGVQEGSEQLSSVNLRTLGAQRGDDCRRRGVQAILGAWDWEFCPRNAATNPRCSPAVLSLRTVSSDFG
jgi:hypothetical protein